MGWCNYSSGPQTSPQGPPNSPDFCLQHTGIEQKNVDCLGVPEDWFENY